MYKNGSKFMLFWILFYIATVLFILPAALVAMGFGEEDIFHLVSSPMFLIASQLLVLLAPLLLWVYAKREAFKNFLEFEPLDMVNVAIIAGISLLIQPAMMFVSGLTGLFFPNVISDVVFGLMDYPFWLVLLAVAVTPSIVEELVFRGYVQKQYESLGIKKAAIISGLFFGIIHMNMQQFFYAFIAGIVFSYIVYYTKSIVSGMLAHFVMNGSQLLLVRMALIAEYEMAEAYDAMPMPEFTPEFVVIAVGIFALFTTPPAIILLISLIKRCKKAHETNELSTADHEPLSPPVKNKPFTDPYLLAVVAIYAVFIIFMSL